jgi:chloramphenicol-sensitive protein RarD
VWTETHGTGHFASGWGLGIDALLVFCGVLTALPLIGFAYAVRRVPLSVVGLMQYIAPTLQFLIGALVFGEAFDSDRAVGFAFIWSALVIFALDGIRRSRRSVALSPLRQE